MNFSVGEYIRPCKDEKVSGDIIIVKELEDSLQVSMVDVLGHGDDAHAVAKKIERFLMSTEALSPSSILKALNKDIQSTRGAAVGICNIHRESGAITYSGIGNTGIRIRSSKVFGGFSKEGVVGQYTRSIEDIEGSINNGDIIIMHSDGLTSRFNFPQISNETNESLSVIARDFVYEYGKEFDDSSCVIIECRK